jgi:O-antigen/teichoic acid export membrane protein
MTGGLISQIIPLIVSLFMTRIYSSSDIGFWILFISIGSVLSVLGTGRYENAIILAKNETENIHIVALSFVLTFTFSVLILLLIILYITVLTSQSTTFILLPFYIIFNSTNQILGFVLIRNKLFTQNSKGRILQAFITGILTVTFGYNRVFENGLIWASILGLASTTIYWFFICNIQNFIPLIVKKKIFAVAKTYKNLPKFNLIHALLNSISSNIPTMVMAYYFSTTIVAYYGLSLRIILQPFLLISTSISQVLNQQFAEMLNNKISIFNRIKDMTLIFTIIGLSFFSIIMVFAKDIFEMLYGKNYLEAGKFTRILIPWFFMIFVNSGFSYIPILFNKQRDSLFIEIVYFTLRIFSLWIGAIMFRSIYWTLALYSVIGFIILIYSQIWILKIAKDKT